MSVATISHVHQASVVRLTNYTSRYFLQDIVLRVFDNKVLRIVTQQAQCAYVMPTVSESNSYSKSTIILFKKQLPFQ